MRAIITVVGKDKVGIIYQVTKVLAENQVNVLDISQTVMGEDMFTMAMWVDASKSSTDFQELISLFEELGKKIGVSIRLQREEIFDAMHKI